MLVGASCEKQIKSIKIHNKLKFVSDQLLNERKK